MNTRFLATLCAIAETGSLAGAARRLNLANATVSEQMRSLERELDAVLLARQGRQLVPTEAGQAVLAAAGDILARVEELRHIAQLGRLRGLLRVGAISTSLISIVPPALRLMAGRHPGIEIKVLPGTSAQLYAMLERGELDCALVVEPHFTLPKRLSWQAVRREPLVLVAPAGPAAETIPGLLRATPLIRVDRESWSGRLIDAFLKEQDLAPRELFELDAQEAIVILVAQGLGVSLLPDWGIQPPSGTAIRKLPVGDDRYSRAIGLVAARGGREAFCRHFLAALRDGLDSAAEPDRQWA